MYNLFCSLSSCRWDIRQHCPIAMKLFTSKDVVLLDSDSDVVDFNDKPRAFREITSDKLCKIVSNRYNQKITNTVNKVEFTFPRSRVYFHIKE